MAYNESTKERMILSIVLTKAKENPLTELLSPKGGLLYLVLTVRLSFVQPLSLASLDSSPSRGASGETVHFAGTAKASPR